MPERYVGGRRILETVLRHCPERLEEVVLLKGLNDYDEELRSLKNVRRAPREELDELSPMHQGVLMRLKAPPERGIESVLEQKLVLVLDGVMDPQNLGALLRVAEVAGAGAVVIPERKSAPLSAAVRRASAGASELIPLIRVGNLRSALETLKEAGFWTVGTALGDGAQSLFQFSFPEKTALVLGSEGDGIRRLTRDECDFLLELPMFGRIESLNVAQAGAVFLFEYRRQQAAGKAK